MAGKRLGFRRGLCRSCGPVEETEEKVRKPGKFRNSSATRSAGFLTDFPQADEGPRRDGESKCRFDACDLTPAPLLEERGSGFSGLACLSLSSRRGSRRVRSQA